MNPGTLNSTDNDDKLCDPTEEKRVAQLSKLVEDRVKEHDKDVKKAIVAARAAVSNKDKTDAIYLIHSVLETTIPQIYAKDPDVTASPAESVEATKYPNLRQFCKGMEIVLRSLLIKEACLKKRAESALRASMTCGAGWIKLIWQRDYKTDPIIENRIQDAQDNVARIDKLMRDLEDPAQAGEHEATRAALMQQIKAMEDQVEVIAAEGFVLDRPLTEDIIILDESIKDFQEYERASAIAHRIWMTGDRYKTIFSEDVPENISSYKTRDVDSGAQKGDAKTTDLYPVYEVWSKEDNTVYTLLVGAKKWCREPYSPENLGERFYPFFGLAFNHVDGQFEPLSDVKLLTPLQDEYNEIRQSQRNVRKENKPALAYRLGGGLDGDDIDRIQNRKVNDTIGVHGDPDRPVSEDLFNIPSPQYNPGLYDTTPVLRDIEQVSGTADSTRNTAATAKTATEAGIMAESMQGRSSHRVDVVEDWLNEIVKYASEVALQNLTPVQVQQIAGEGTPWPVLGKEEIYRLYVINIRAGSTAKPNKMREREQWVQVYPMIEQMVMKIMQADMQGLPIASFYRKMLKMTMEQFEVRMDVEELIQSIAPQGPALPGAMPGALPPPIPEIQQNPQEAQV